MHIKSIVIILILSYLIGYSQLNAQIHSAPIVIKAKDIKELTGYPIILYRVFKTNKNLQAVQIPFQIDEVNEFGDFVLDKGPSPNISEGNGIFDNNDELVIMGDDVGLASTPIEWQVKKPSLFFEIKFKHPLDPNKVGAIYVGIYFVTPPSLPNISYVSFDYPNSKIISSKFIGTFDKDNYIAIKNISIKDPSTQKFIPLINYSIFYLRINLKYFLTLEVNHKDLKSYLDAYKIGPIRIILRVNFFYNFIKINFKLGMYTEVSIFANAIYLPSILYNPIDGSKILNKDSGFYYGFNLRLNPQHYKQSTNFPKYKEHMKTIFSLFKTSQPTQSYYWLKMISDNHMIYLEFNLSEQMRIHNNIPYLFIDNKDGCHIDKDPQRIKNKPAPLGKSTTNIALYLSLSNLTKGEHNILFTVFFENHTNEAKIQEFKNAKLWTFNIQQL